MNAIVHFDWTNLAGLCGVLAIISSAMLFVVRTRLAHFFVTHTDLSELTSQMRRDHASLSDRLKTMEANVADSPTAADFRGLSARVGSMEMGVGNINTSVGIVGERINSNHQVMMQVQHMLDLILKQMLDKDGKQ